MRRMRQPRHSRTVCRRRSRSRTDLAEWWLAPSHSMPIIYRPGFYSRLFEDGSRMRLRYMKIVSVGPQEPAMRRPTLPRTGCRRKQRRLGTRDRRGLERGENAAQPRCMNSPKVGFKPWERKKNGEDRRSRMSPSLPTGLPYPLAAGPLGTTGDGPAMDIPARCRKPWSAAFRPSG